MLTIAAVSKRQVIGAFAIWLVGALAGLALSVAVIGPRVDRTTVENERLKSQVENLQAQLSSATESLRQRQSVRVRTLDVKVDVRSELLRIEVARAVQELLHGIIGLQISDVQPELIRATLGKRTLELENYTVTIDQIWGSLGETTTIYVYTRGGVGTFDFPTEEGESEEAAPEAGAPANE